MKLGEYFENVQGTGVLATADDQGKVDAALYARPHCLEENRIAFIMGDRLSHLNLQRNPHAVYLFMESGDEYRGKRLYLTKVEESEDEDLIKSMRRRKMSWPSDEKAAPKKSFLVYFKVDSVLPLVGDSE